MCCVVWSRLRQQDQFGRANSDLELLLDQIELEYMIACGHVVVLSTIREQIATFGASGVPNSS